MSNSQMIQTLQVFVARALAATTREEVGAVYLDMVGYDCAADDPEATIEDLRDLALDYVSECCYEFGIHVTLTGLPGPN